MIFIINTIIIFNCFFTLCHSQELQQKNIHALQKNLCSMNIMHEKILRTIEAIETNEKKFILKAQSIEEQLKTQDDNSDLKEFFAIAITNTKQLKILKDYWEQQLINLKTIILKQNELIISIL